MKPVGSFTGLGKEDEELIFDLGGNVAEWQIVSGGKGKFTGGSADCPSDAKSNCAAAAEYVGFRVVRGAPSQLTPAPYHCSCAIPLVDFTVSSAPGHPRRSRLDLVSSLRSQRATLFR